MSQSAALWVVLIVVGAAWGVVLEFDRPEPKGGNPLVLFGAIALLVWGVHEILLRLVTR